ncbi:hypothetical protein [uncultured Ruegeria sp.]|uniref:hypothetical protein n=1 Tax=uncultured Ruegeria sp. TaxID=259304 RepID=UPI002634A70E|nr:hypothetical protein [uncultured Ruegeria sp.]
MRDALPGSIKPAFAARSLRCERKCSQPNRNEPRTCCIIQLLLACFLLFAPHSIAWAGRDDGDLLRFIRHFEARGSYDIFYADIRQPPPKPLTQMTVGEVLIWQGSLKGTRSTAAGGYQFIRGTLADLVQRHNIPRSARFDQNLQDRLARHLIDDCAGARARGTTAFGNCLAEIWAALPLLSGPQKGRSAYHGIAGNRALTTPENFTAVLQGLPYRTPTIRQARASVPSGHRTVVPRHVRIRSAMKETAAAANAAMPKQVWTTDPYAVD